MAEAWPGCQCYDPGIVCCGADAIPDGKHLEDTVYKCLKCGGRWIIHADIRAIEVAAEESGARAEAK